MEMTPEEFRRIALSFPGAIERSHMDHPDFRVAGRIFATLWKGDGVLALKPKQQARIVKSDPDTYSPVKGGWGKRGATVVHLEAADKHSVRSAMSVAWRNRAQKNKAGP